jgi:DNA (cytosine-5)-methyltransferase 1
MRRIAHGIKRYVLDAESPFIVQVSQSESMVTPILSKYHGQKTESDSRCRELQEPFATLDTQPRFALVAPTLTRQFGKSDSSDISQPLPTIVAGGGGKTALVAAFVAKHFGGQVGAEAAKPLPTTTTRGTQNQLVTANLIHMNHGEKQWSSVEDPLRTVTSNNHAALVYAFLVKFFGTSNSANLHEPMPTATTKDRFGFVTVEIDNETYVITDIGMRMLTPRELARAQGFPETYVLTGTKTSQVARIGNSVCPAIAKAIVEANYASVLSGAK